MDAYAWVLEQLKAALATLGHVFSPKVSITDCSAAILGALSEKFVGIKKVNCWAHVWRLMEPKIKPLGELGALICKEMIFLQQLPSKELFDKGAELFFSKWSQIDSVNRVLSSIKRSYFSGPFCNWYEAFDVFSPSTNSRFERFNRTIKRSFGRSSHKKIGDKLL